MAVAGSVREGEAKEVVVGQLAVDDLAGDRVGTQQLKRR